MADRSEGFNRIIVCSCFLMLFITATASAQTWGEAIDVKINDSFSIEYVKYARPVSWEEAASKCGQSKNSIEEQHLLCFENRAQISKIISQSDFKNFSIWLSGRNCYNKEVEKCLSLVIIQKNQEHLWNFVNSCEQRHGFICRKFLMSEPNNLQVTPKGERDENLKMCPETNRRNITWPMSPGNSSPNIKCPNNFKGYARWYCNGTTGEWGPGPPNLAGCRSVYFTNVLKNVEDGLNKPRENVIDLEETALSLRQNIKGLQTGGDLATTVEILDKVEDIFVSQAPTMSPASQKKMALSTSNHVINSCSELLTKSEAWHDLAEDNKYDVATTFLTAVDETGSVLASSIETREHFIRTDNVVLQVVKEEKNTARIKTFHGREGNTLTLITGPETKHVTFSYYTDLRGILPSNQDMSGPDSKTLNSAVISANISEGRLYGKVKFRLKHFNTSLQKASCVFWDKNSLRWSSDGCQILESNEDYTECQCNHLTNFALLMDFGCITCDADIVHQVALTFITILGCSISIVCLSICVAVFTLYRSLWGLRIMIHRNLCMCLIIAQAVLLGGLERTENEIVCTFIAVFLHYFFLAAFFWMFLDALHMLWLLIKVFEPRESQFIKFYIAGYGCPALIVAITAGIKHTGYGTPLYCWLNTQDETIWGFAGPVLVIALFNSMTLCFALHKSGRHIKNRSVIDTGENVHLKNIRKWARGAIIYMPLQGGTWLFGFLYVDSNFIAFAYIFAVLNSLQGLGIFLFHCLLNKKVREHVIRAVSRPSSIIQSNDRSSKRTTTTPSSASPKSRSRFFVGVTPAPDHHSPKAGEKEELNTFLQEPRDEENERVDANGLYPLEMENETPT